MRQKDLQINVQCCKLIYSVRGMECRFFNNKIFLSLSKYYIKIVDKVFKQKHGACNFDTDKDEVKIHKIREQRFRLGQNCDKMIEHKEVFVTNCIIIAIYKEKKHRTQAAGTYPS